MDKMFSNLRIATCKLAMSIILLGLTLAFATSVYAATYYIDYVSGNDSNTANNSKATPWKRHPYMNGFNGTYNHQAGDRFIFKGGVSWPNACFPLYMLAGGNASASDYYGVDLTWFDGDEWIRPIFDAGNSWLNKTAHNVNLFVLLADYSTLDNIEFIRYYWDANHQWWGSCFMIDGSNLGTLTKNCYFHDWGHASYASGCKDELRIIVAGVVENCIFDGGVNGDSGVAFSAKTIRNSIIRNVPNGALTWSDGSMMEVSGCTIGPIVGSFQPDNAHENAIEPLSSGDISIFKNVIFDVREGVVILIPGNTDLPNHNIYIYNNIFYKQVTAPHIEMEAHTNDKSVNWYIDNNVFVGENGPVITSGGGNLGKLYVRNNHMINIPNGGAVNLYGTVVADVVNTNNVYHTTNQAAAIGATITNLYRPTIESNELVNKGINLSSMFTADFLGTDRGTVWDIGAYEYNSGAPADTTPPTITAFTIPATTTSLTVPITTLTATDTIGVSGYKLTESATAPLANASGWTSSKPSYYTFTTAGSQTLYAWAKDAAGNVSTSLNDSVTITLPPVIYGDVSGDGQVTTADSIMIARYSAGLITFTNTQKTAADVSGNGQISSYDASLISQRVSGLISKFPVE